MRTVYLQLTSVFTFCKQRATAVGQSTEIVNCLVWIDNDNGQNILFNIDHYYPFQLAAYNLQLE